MMIRRIAIMLILVLGNTCLLFGQEKFELFEKHFIDKTMRIDYYHIGDAESETFTLDHIYQYGIWAGSREHLLDNFNNGRYYARVCDTESGELIFSKGYDSFFAEYKSSEPATAGIKRTFHESILIPCPKNKVELIIERRNDRNELVPVFKYSIAPQNIAIIKKSAIDRNVQVLKYQLNGDPHANVDIAILSEGYSAGEQEKFAQDLQRFGDIMFIQEPYKSMKHHFNIYGVFKPSEESGVDEPRAEIYKNTVLNATFNSLGSERYLMTEDNKAMRDLAAHVPYDAIYIMVNHKRYGGGGIYNLYCTFTSDNQFREYLFLHEFGHSFAGLADEYYTSAVAYNDFYPKNIEPVEPNITALLDPQNIKWIDKITPGIEIPTPWEKEEYDRMDLAWQKRRAEMNDRIAELKRRKTSGEEVGRAEEEYDLADRNHSQKIDSYLSKSAYVNKVGAFEGAGYSSRGLYRPMLDCIMFSKGHKPFCVVCEDAIRKVINHYLE